MPQLSKYPIGNFPKTQPAVFLKCGHPVQLLPKKGETPSGVRVELEGYCWACREIKKL